MNCAFCVFSLLCTNILITLFDIRFDVKFGSPNGPVTEGKFLFSTDDSILIKVVDENPFS
jgi:hypothetical protein